MTETSYRLRKSSAALLEKRTRETRAQGLETPYSAMLEIADRCNESCVHCYQVQGQKGELPTAAFKRAMDDLAQLGVLFLTFSGGEATLRKDFVELVRYARKLRFAVKIYSNALKIDEALANELGALAVQEVQISLYSHRAAVHDEVTRVPGSFDQVVRATQWLRAAGVAVVLKTPAMSFNLEELSEYSDFVKGLGAEYSMDPHLNPREDGSEKPLEFSATRESHLALKNNPQFTPRRSRKPLTHRGLDSRPCKACRSNVHVEPNGEVRPCAQWSVSTGNVQQEGGLVSAWRDSPRAIAIRELTWRSLPGCRQCDLRQYCRRCFSDASLHTGNALSPYTAACQRATWSYELRSGARPELLPNASGSSDTGPYRKLGEHRFLATSYELTEEDRTRLREHPWLLDGGAPAPPREPDIGPLVQLRRRPSATLRQSEHQPSNTAGQTLECSNGSAR